MDWLLENWHLCLILLQKQAYFLALINPIGIAVSVIAFVIGVVAARARKTIWMSLFALWLLIPLHHFTVEGQEPAAGNVAGYGAMGAFGVGILIVVAVGFYVFLIRE